jgi:hypothetical protein
MNANVGSGIGVRDGVGAGVALGAVVVAAGVGDAVAVGVGEACVAAGAHPAAMNKTRTKASRFIRESIYLTDDGRIRGVPAKAYECATRYVH